MKTTVFFDFDGVLTTDKSGSYTTCANLQRVLPDLSVADILKCYRENHRQLLLGEIVHADIWDAFCDSLGQQIDISSLDMAFRNTPKNEDVFAICRALAKSHCLGIITDNSRDRFATVKEEMELPSLFDHFIVSGEIGSRKDSERTFRAALDAAKAKPQECVFIDNNPANLVVPKGLGFSVVHHDDERNDVGELRNQLRDCGITLE
jgi:FMN phosphatase YigB (HAD superfamily)